MNAIELGLLAVALLALAGWTAVLVLFSRSLLPMANALAVLQKVDSVIDDRIMRVVTRIQDRQNKGKPAPRPQSNPNEAAVEAVANLFGGAPLEPFGEQPDPEGLEVIG